MQDTLHQKTKSMHMPTRSSEQSLLEPGKGNKFANSSFAQKTAQVWNAAPAKVKQSTTIYKAKRQSENM